MQIVLVFFMVVSSQAATIPVALSVAGVPNVGNDPRWTRFTKERDSLQANSTRGVFVTPQEIWIGGDEGLSRFNGQWTAYTAATVVGLPADQTLGHVLAFSHDDRTGRIWAGTDSGLLLAWDGAKWFFVHDLGSPILALAMVEGELWAGTLNGAYRFNGVDVLLLDALGLQPVFALAVTKTQVWVGAGDGLWLYQDQRWSHPDGDEPGLASGVYALAVDAAGRVFVGTDAGVGWQVAGAGRWEWFATLDDEGVVAPVQALALDHSSVLWAATNGAGAYALDYTGSKVYHYGFIGDGDLTTRFIRGVGVDADNSIWFTTAGGVFRFQTYRWINDVQGSPSDLINHANDMIVARDGALWVATAGGGVRRKTGPQGTEQVFTAVDGAANAGFALAQDARGAIWVGSDYGLRRYMDGVWDVPISTSRLPDPAVGSLLVDGNTIWVGTAAGLVAVDVVSSAVQPVPELDGIAVEALALDHKGQLWAGTSLAGVWLREAPDRWRQFRHNPADPTTLPDDTVVTHGLAADPTGRGIMWVIGQGGDLALWSGREWVSGETLFPVPSGLLWTLYAAPRDGSLWIGSETGVTRYDGETWATLTAEDGLQSATIFAVARTLEGGYWFGGQTGLSYFLPDKTAPWIKFDVVSDGEVVGPDGSPISRIGAEAMFPYQAGDLQTPHSRLLVLQRVTGPGETDGWRPTDDDYARFTPEEPGTYLLELWARDLAFNYSTVTSLEVQVIKPVAMVVLPLMGEVTVGVFRLLLALISLTVFGGVYVAVVWVNNRQRSIEALARGFNPYISGEPVRRNDMFFGRRDLLQRIIDSLHSNSIMIHGERRIGKTSLLLQLMTTLREVDDPEYWFVPVYVDMEGTPQDSFFMLLIEEILAEVEKLADAETAIAPKLHLLRYYTKTAGTYNDRDFYRDLYRITEALEAYGEVHDAGKRLRLILLMDEMDVMSSYDRLVQQQLRRIFMREFAATLGAVVAGIQISKDWDRVESPWFNLFNEIELTPFTREQAVELLTEPVRGYYTFEPAALEFVLEHAEGRPFRLQQYGLEAVNQMLVRKRRRITLADVEAAHRRIQVAERTQVAKPGQLAPFARAQQVLDAIQVSFQRGKPANPPPATGAKAQKRVAREPRDAEP